MSERDMSQEAIVIERVFEAPAALVWQLWTQPEHFKNWYGPQGFTIPVSEKDLRVGGRHLCCMASPDGSMKMWSAGEFTEVLPPRRLVYTESPADENGDPVSPAALGMPPGYPLTTTVTVELTELDDGRTRMVMTHAGMPADSGAGGGWAQAFAKMDAYLATVRRQP